MKGHHLIYGALVTFFGVAVSIWVINRFTALKNIVYGSTGTTG